MNAFVKHFWMVSCCLLMLAACTENDQLTDRSDDDWFDVAVRSTSMVSSYANITCGTPKTYTLCAGQNSTYGSVSVSNDQENLYIKYEASQSIIEVHLWVGTNLLDVPGKNSPAPGLFPYKSMVNGTSYVFTIPLNGTINPYYIIAHAAFANGETGYASLNCPITSRIWKNWAQHILYNVQSCNTDPGQEICGTGFAYLEGQSKCFLEIPNLNNNRWGWVIGPLSRGTYNSIPVWANAGQCDRSKGQHVADAEVEYNGSNVSFRLYNIDSDYDLYESHYNVSHEQKPTTTAPGRYNCNTGNCTVSAAGQSIYVIIHTSSSCEGSGGGIDPS